MAETPSTTPTQELTSVPCGWRPRLRVRSAVLFASVLGAVSVAGVALTAHPGGAGLACGPLLIGWG